MITTCKFLKLKFNHKYLNIDEHLNTICSLNKLNNKDYIKNIFDDIDTLNKSFKSLKQQFSQDNICI